MVRKLPDENVSTVSGMKTILSHVAGTFGLLAVVV